MPDFKLDTTLQIITKLEQNFPFRTLWGSRILWRWIDCIITWTVWSSLSSGLTSLKLSEVSKCSLELKCCGECRVLTHIRLHSCWGRNRTLDVSKALLVLPTPGDHSPIAVRCVQMSGPSQENVRLLKKKSPISTLCLWKLYQHIGDHVEIGVRS